MELRIRGTQNEKTNFAGTHFSENKIREQSNVNRTFWTKTREHRTYRTRTRTKMSLLSMLSQNRLLQQNQQSMPQLTQPFQVNIMVFMFWLWAMALNDQSRVSPRDVTPPARRGNTFARTRPSRLITHSKSSLEIEKPKKINFREFLYNFCFSHFHRYNRWWVPVLPLDTATVTDMLDMFMDLTVTTHTVPVQRINQIIWFHQTSHMSVISVDGDIHTWLPSNSTR